MTRYILSILFLLSFSLTCEASCNSYFKEVEDEYNIPRNLLKAISAVESNLNANAVSVAGKPFYGEDREAALKHINHNLEQGKTNIDVGCMQLNYKYHASNFESLEEMLTPENNIKYAAAFLKKLYEQTGNWRDAVARYHSSNPEYQNKYTPKILVSWLNM